MLLFDTNGLNGLIDLTVIIIGLYYDQFMCVCVCVRVCVRSIDQPIILPKPK